MTTPKNVSFDDALSIIGNLLQQIEQMRGMFDDSDGTIADAVSEAEQFQNDYAETIAGGEIRRHASIGPWDSLRYGHDGNQRGPDFEVNVIDRLRSSGQVFVDVYPDGGNIDDRLSTMVEVANHPETGHLVPVVRVSRGDEVISSVYADGMDKALLLVASGVLQAGFLRLKEE